MPFPIGSRFSFQSICKSKAKRIFTTIVNGIYNMNKRGDILEAANRHVSAGLHYIIYYDGYDSFNFIGAMITHSNTIKNTSMNKSHFIEKDSLGNYYKVQFDDTYLVKAKLMKFESWGPFTKVGELSPEGVKFVESTIDNLISETWEEYLSRQ